MPPRQYPALDITWPLRPDDDRLDILIAEVDDEGPTAVEEIQDGIRMFFPTAVARGRAAVRLVALEPDLTCEPVEVSDEDWAERSQASLESVTVGRIVVSPREGDDAGSGVFITIRPSMGFGTGHHASTRLCLRLLQELPLAGRTVLDAGTGSAVLAIAAAKLGAASVVAIDNDPDALTSARENVELNDVGERVEVMLRDLDRGRPALAGPATSADLQGSSYLPSAEAFDFVFANLTGGLLIKSASVLRHLLASDGRLIVSGVLASESDEVVAAMSAAGTELVSRADEEEWIGAVFRAI